MQSKPEFQIIDGDAKDGTEFDHFIEQNGVLFAGRHLLIDLWGCQNLDDIDLVRQALTESVEAAGATLLNIDLHVFNSSGGISGVAILAESHMSIHTWPENGYAALDVFVCGDCDPHRAVPVLRTYFLPENVQLSEVHRGVVT